MQNNLLTQAKGWGFALACAVGLITTPCAIAQAVFPISGYRVVGNSLLSENRIEEVTHPFTGLKCDFETIQGALESLEKAYVAAGFGSVRLEVPEQELDAGVVTLQVTEGVLGQVLVEANPFFDAENVAR